MQCPRSVLELISTTVNSTFSLHLQYLTLQSSSLYFIHSCSICIVHYGFAACFFSSLLLHYLLVRLRHERLRIILTFTSQIHCVQDGLVPAHSSCLHNFCPKSSLEWILYISETMIEVSIKTVINDFVF